MLGVEGSSHWTPGLFQDDDVSFEVPQELVHSSRSIVAMGNVVLTLPRRWTEYGLRPFVSGGFGVMHVVNEDVGIFPVSAEPAGVQRRRRRDRLLLAADRRALRRPLPQHPSQHR